MKKSFTREYRERTFFSQQELNRLRHERDIVNSQIKRAGKTEQLHTTLFVCGCNARGGCGFAAPINQDGQYETL